jgi:NAD(P)-dependent dehydrogenase (short-subunit alcohol dehydrogenase family)
LALLFDLSQKVAVVTGAGSGIGAAIAVLFARQGARVVALDLNESAEAIAATIAAGGGDATARRCNVAEPDDVARTFRGVAAEFGRLDILVNTGQTRRWCSR